MDLLGRNQRKTLRQIEAHLVPEHAVRAGSCAVFLRAVVANAAHEFEILLHVPDLPDLSSFGFLEVHFNLRRITLY